MDVQDLQEITITRKEIREIYDQGPEAVETLVLALVDKINFLTSVVKEQDLSPSSPLKNVIPYNKWSYYFLFTLRIL